MRLFFTALFLLVTTITAFAQTGTYQLNDKLGASFTIAIVRQGNRIHASIFAWWHTPSGRNGNFDGSGQLKNNQVVLKGQGDDAGCTITLTFVKNKLNVQYTDCMEDNLLPEFSGSYPLITKYTPGEYLVAAPKAHIYRSIGKKPSKAYLVKGDKVLVDLENIFPGGWVYINYEGAKGRSTSGYMHLADLR